jgi:phospholipid/cholesterol/gamma-HCH transport system substrate-binding protein
MQKRAPTLGNLLVIALFVLSCFGLLLFLWESFGGPVPLKPKNYQFHVSFPQALQLAEQADVRISGVQVGHVTSFNLDKDGRANATIEMDSRYAPVRANVRVILRQKTLLGETYVQILPAAKSGPFIPDGGKLANTHVEPSVTLDQILSVFNPRVRRDFRLWMQSLSASFNGRGEDLNASFASLEPFVVGAGRLTGILASQEGAIRGVVHSTGSVFDAISERDHQLEGFIANGERTFHAAAQSSTAFAEAFRALPTFESRSRVALQELDSLAADASPLFDQLRPAERQLTPTVQALAKFSPPFSGLMTGLGAFTRASKQGVPALSRALALLPPQFAQLIPVLHNLDPFLQYLGEYEPEIEAFFANFTAASQGHNINSNDPGAGLQHYLRTMQVLGPETLAVYPHRIGTDRANPYPHAGALASLGTNLQVFSNSACSNPVPAVSETPSEQISQSIIEEILKFHVANSPGKPNAVPAPPCSQQGPFTFNEETSQFPHVTYAPGK